MTIANRDQLLNAMGNNSVLFPFNKSSIGNQSAGSFTSLWRSTGAPGQGAVPTTAAICDRTLAGALYFTNPTSPARQYIARVQCINANTGMELQLHDRLSHMGGLSGTVTTAQTVNVDVSGSSSNLANRRGATDYSEVIWWLEWYADTGTTGTTATIAVTLDDGTTTTTTATVGVTTRSQRLTQFLSPTAGRYIKSVQSVTLAASTLTAGNFGVTATRLIASIPMGLSNNSNVVDWQQLGLPRVHDDACLTFAVVAVSGTTNAVLGNIKLVQG